jgi:sugar diacid utilization regulator
MIKKNQMRSEIISALYKQVPDLVNITGGLGVSYGKEFKYFPAAQRAASRFKPQRGKGIYWVPFKIDPRTIIVCGLKSVRLPQKEKGLIEGLITEIRFEYFLKDQVEKFIEPKSNFIKDLLESDKYTDFDQAVERGDLLGINLRAPQAVILIEIPGLFKKLHHQCQKKSANETVLYISKSCTLIANKISASFKNYDQNVIACISPDRFVVLKSADGDVNTLNSIKYFKSKGEYIRKIVSQETGITVTVGVGQYYPDINGLRKSYSDAINAAELGRRIWGQGRTYHITDIGMYITLSKNITHERKAELANQLLGNILSDKDLYKTVKIFLGSNMNLTVAAGKLHLHRNTLIYRLEKIRQEYGLDPRRFSDAVHIKLGIMLYGPEIRDCRPEAAKRVDARLKRIPSTVSINDNGGPFRTEGG